MRAECRSRLAGRAPAPGSVDSKRKHNGGGQNHGKPQGGTSGAAFMAGSIICYDPGCMKANLTAAARAVAMDIAADELAHVSFLRSAIMAANSTPVSQPLINIVTAFSAAANAAFNTTLPTPFNA
ncbi:hypothetical protein CEUSTIGMA_g1881.t1 [Chlamydomonas eustigma]|uniref:Uncharacterized protein n=1 Tax=Chlamydomonas eustigma TaxID=1157962 RepID=A0A250WUX3_9CHLO|nr:hypothetical protein CEUSTIGMA_g1881.t1 [Chlamydomonas eustigma]|eukprot:GAX74432.1 hypothetical protein CEUSTIGMA_g1881.t1 [Chlamydomonas eustigma]